jgi:rRNA maturation RNase YbeY
LLFDKNEIVCLCENVLSSEDVSNYDISMIFVNNKYIVNLNKRFFNKDKTTDVISFNISEKGIEIEGEVYINIDIINSQAEYYSVSFEEEMKRLVIHGLLHLVGYKDDRKNQKKEIREKEDYYLTI